MSIFVKDTDLIDVAVHYAEENGNVIVIDEATSHTTTLSVKFRRPDFSISQRLMATSTTLDQSGNPSINLMLLQNNMLYFLAKEWDAKEPDIMLPATKDAEGKDVPATTVIGKPVELNAENLGSLRVEIARALIAKLLPVVGQII